MDVDPGQITTVEDLTEQLRALFDQTGKSYERLAADSKVAAATLHELVNKADSFPRRDTLREFVRACGQDEAPWMRAWARADQARAKPARTSVQDLRAEADNLRSDLGEARQQRFNAEVAREAALQVAKQRIQDLASQLAAARQELEETRREHQHDRDARAAAGALTRIGQPHFRQASGKGGSGSGYDMHEVQALMRELRASAEQGSASLAQHLAFHSLPIHGVNSKDFNGCYDAEDVDTYLAQIRRALNELF